VDVEGPHQAAGVPAGAGPDAREVLSWELFGTAVRRLAQEVVDSGFVPDLVLGIARGGLPFAGTLAYALGAKAVGTLNVEFYTGVDATLDEPVVLPPLLDMDAVTGATVLVVDDVADSGRTLDLVLRLVRERGTEARAAVIYHKPRSVVRPDYAWRRTDRWIVFPWSAEPPVTRRA
jgi:hypoxanthine phosphoribosyltransferase